MRVVNVRVCAFAIVCVGMMRLPSVSPTPPRLHHDLLARPMLSTLFVEQHRKRARKVLCALRPGTRTCVFSSERKPRTATLLTMRRRASLLGPVMGARRSVLCASDAMLHHFTVWSSTTCRGRSQSASCGSRLLWGKPRKKLLLILIVCPPLPRCCLTAMVRVSVQNFSKYVMLRPTIVQAPMGFASTCDLIPR